MIVHKDVKLLGEKSLIAIVRVPKMSGYWRKEGKWL